MSFSDYIQRVLRFLHLAGLRADADMTFSDYLDRVLIGTGAKGCSESEIKQLERRYEVLLPEDYREFLLRAGKGAQLWRGSDFTLDLLAEMQEDAIDLLDESGLTLPQGSFVFFMHQGYQFFFLNGEGVFYFLEGEDSTEKRQDSFDEFFRETQRL